MFRPSCETVFFDTNAISDFFRESRISAELKRAALLKLRERVRFGKTRLAVSESLLTEIACLHSFNPELFHRIRRELKRFTRCDFLLHPTDIISREARRCGVLRDREIRFDRKLATQLWRGFEGGSIVNQMGSSGLKEKDEYLSDERSARAKVDRYVHVNKVDVQKFYAGAEPLEGRIRDWCVDDIEREGESWGLSSDRLKLVSPRDVPTLVNVRGYFLANLDLLHREGRRIEKGTKFDLSHYAYAAYVDFLVTNDRRFLETTRVLERSRARCLDEFAEMLVRGD